MMNKYFIYGFFEGNEQNIILKNVSKHFYETFQQVALISIIKAPDFVYFSDFLLQKT